MELDLLVPRYLVPLDLETLPVIFADVLVVGTGVAGMSAAIRASDTGRVLLVSKRGLRDTNTDVAQGGIAAAVGSADSPDEHARDTLEAGGGLADREVVRFVVREAAPAIERLRGWGAQFDEVGGSLSLTREGGHGSARIVHAADRTGTEISRVLLARVAEQRRIECVEHTFALDLAVDESGRCCGAFAWNERRGFVFLAAAATVCATGGTGQIYRETTNPEIATGDGLALGFRAGARLRGLEFVQFHPTLLYVAGAGRVLISEIVRGAGAVLRDRRGVAFMAAVHPSGDLAPRDVVTRAIHRRMAESGDTHVFLDLREVPDAGARFPGLAAVCRDLDLDLARDPIPVRPGAHYGIGGIAVDRSGRTGVPGLFACGEAASSGLHGANRLGSNSLLEGLVFGDLTGRLAGDEPRANRWPLRLQPAAASAGSGRRTELHVNDLVYSLKSLLQRLAGVERSEEGLREAAELLRFWGRIATRQPFVEARGWELANMLLVARLLVECARFREESRGVHYRTDYPQPDPSWRRHVDAVPRGREGGAVGGVIRTTAAAD